MKWKHTNIGSTIIGFDDKEGGYYTLKPGESVILEKRLKRGYISTEKVTVEKIKKTKGGKD